MQQPIINRTNDAPTAGVAQYLALHAGNYDWDSDILDATQLAGAAGTLKNLKVKIQVAPGAGDSITYTVMVDGNPTLLAVTISNAETEKENVVNEIAIAEGARLCIRGERDAGAANPLRYQHRLIFEGDTPNESLILGLGYGDNLHTTSTEYNALQGGRNWGANQPDRQTRIPTAGSIKNLYIYLQTAPGAGNSFVFTVYLNGNPTTLTCTLSGAEIADDDQTNSFAVVAGDYVYIQVNPDSSPDVGRCCYGTCFVATTDGESFISYGNSDALSNSATEYNQLPKEYGDRPWSAADDDVNIVPACILKLLYVKLTASPGAGNSYEFTIMDSGAPSIVTTTISDAETEDQDVVNSVILDEDDEVSIRCDPDSTPTVRDASYAVVLYIEPIIPELGPSGGELQMRLGIGAVGVGSHIGYDLKTRGGKARRRAG